MLRLPVKLFEVLSKLSIAVTSAQFNLVGVETPNIGSKARQTLLSTSTNSYQHHITPRLAKDTADTHHVLYCVLEEYCSHP
jgi:hypothetical protein